MNINVTFSYNINSGNFCRMLVGKDENMHLILVPDIVRLNTWLKLMYNEGELNSTTLLTWSLSYAQMLG